jgi:hypothetical protein
MTAGGSDENHDSCRSAARLTVVSGEDNTQAVDSMLERFRELSERAGDDDEGLATDVDHALSLHEESFEETELRPTKESGVLTWHLTWRGLPLRSIADLDRSFFRLLADFAEQSQFVSRFIEHDSIRYEVVMGSIGHRPHAHRVRFRVAGPEVNRVMKDYRDILKTK